MAPAKKSHKSTKPPENAAGRVNKQPPAKAKSTTTASSSRQLAGPAKGGAGSSKTTQKPTQKPEAVVGNNKRKAAEVIEGDEERTISELSLHAEGGNQANEATPAGPGVAKMPILTSRVRTIREDVVASKWTPMSEKARGEVFDVLKAAEIPVLMTFKKDKQKALAQEGLRIVMRRLRALVTKTPVPPVGRDTGLSYERLVDKNRELESILEPNLRQIAELEAEIEREQKCLEKDEAYYEGLSKNAVSQENIRRQQARSMHPLLKNTAETTGGLKDGIDDIGLSSAKLPAVASSYDVNSDRQILPLTKALQQHLSSMQGNSGPLEELTEWIQRSRAAVDEVLFERVGETVYDGIMGL